MFDTDISVPDWKFDNKKASFVYFKLHANEGLLRPFSVYSVPAILFIFIQTDYTYLFRNIIIQVKDIKSVF